MPSERIQTSASIVKLLAGYGILSVDVSEDPVVNFYG